MMKDASKIPLSILLPAFLFAALVAGPTWADSSWQQAITVSEEGGTSGTVTFGVEPTATDGIDGSLGEVEQPPLPPAGNFDIRFTGAGLGNGVMLDLRSGAAPQAERTLTLAIQRAAGGNITLSWNSAQISSVTTSAVVQDLFGGVLFSSDMRTESQVIITNAAITSVQVKFTSVDGVEPVAPPQAVFEANPTSGVSPLTVQFTDLSSGTITQWEWDFNNDGTYDSTVQNPTYVFDLGSHTVVLRVTGPGGMDTETKAGYINVQEAISFTPVNNDTISDGTLHYDYEDDEIDGLLSWSSPRALSLLEIIFDGNTDATVSFQNASGSSDDSALGQNKRRYLDFTPLGYGIGQVAVTQDDDYDRDRVPVPVTSSVVFGAGSAALETGHYAIKFKATDLSGNVDPEVVRTNIYVDVDDIDLKDLFPTKAAFGPVNEPRIDTLNKHTSKVTFQLSEPADSLIIAYRAIFGVDFGRTRTRRLAGSELTNTYSSQIFPVDSLRDNTAYMLTVLARDLAGNYMRTRPDTFFYDTSYVAVGEDGPFVNEVSHRRRAVFPDESVEIFARVLPNLATVTSVQADVYRNRGEAPVAAVGLLDDGSPPDMNGGDGIYTGKWGGSSQLGKYTIDLAATDMSGRQTKLLNADSVSVAHNILSFPDSMLVSPESLDNARLPLLVEDDGSGYLNNGFLSTAFDVHMWEEGLMTTSPVFDFVETGLEGGGFLMETWTTSWQDAFKHMRIKGSMADVVPLHIANPGPAQEVFVYVNVEITPEKFGRLGVSLDGFRFEEENVGAVTLPGGFLGLGRGDVNVNKDIDAFDASLVLMHVVGRINLDDGDDPVNDAVEAEYGFTFPSYTQPLADVSGAWGISSLDAALIMQRDVGIIKYFPPEEGYYRLWDPPAWWNSPVGLPAKPAVADSPLLERVVSLGSVGENRAGLWGVSVLIDDMEGILAGSFTLRYDPQYLEPVGVEKSELTEAYLFADYVQDNTIRIGFAGAEWKVGDGALAEVWFKPRTSGLEGIEGLELVDVHLNESNVHAQIVAGVGPMNVVPRDFALYANYPNPFNPETTIRYALPVASEVEMAVFNLAGQLVVTLVEGIREAGVHEVRWDGVDARGGEVASGVYLYRLQVEGGKKVGIRKLLLLR